MKTGDIYGMQEKYANEYECIRDYKIKRIADAPIMPHWP